MKDNLKTLAAVVAITGAAYLLVTYQVSLWQECRATNSWGYCMQVLSK